MPTISQFFGMLIHMHIRGGIILRISMPFTAT